MTWTAVLLIVVYVVGWLVTVRIVHHIDGDDYDPFIACHFGFLWPLALAIAAVVGVFYSLQKIATGPIPIPHLRRRKADQGRIRELERELGLGDKR